MYLGMYAFIGGIVLLGAGIGFWLQRKLITTNQIVTLPSTFNAEKYMPVIQGGGSRAVHSS